MVVAKRPQSEKIEESGRIIECQFQTLFILMLYYTLRSEPVLLHFVNSILKHKPKSRSSVARGPWRGFQAGSERAHGRPVSAVKSLRCHWNRASQCFWAAASTSLKRRGMEDSFGIRRPFYVMSGRRNKTDGYDYDTSTVNQGGRWEYCAIGVLWGSKKAARKTTSMIPVVLPFFWRVSLSRPMTTLLPGQPSYECRTRTTSLFLSSR